MKNKSQQTKKLWKGTADNMKFVKLKHFYKGYILVNIQW